MNSTGLQKIRLERLLAVQYQHPNLAEAKRFFVDFGLNIVRQDEEKVFFRGFGADAFCYIAEQSEDRRRHFVGGIWLVHSIDDLEAASKLPGASRLESSSAPGGGKCVELVDPVGLKVTLVYGIHARAEESVANEAPGDVTINSWINKPRKGVFQRFVRGPSKVHKCGHYGVAVDEASFDEELSWYLTTFTLATTDTICDGETGKDLMVFLHLDKGEEYVDHHSFFMWCAPQRIKSAFAHHTSFEIDNFDSHAIGHDWLLRQGWTNAWGIGRHKLGSQIFDYWFDSSGNIVEHYSDGDLVNNKTPVGRELASPDTASIWGPSASRAFLDGRIEDSLDPNASEPV